MKKPKQPKFKYLKKNTYIDKYLVPIGDKRYLQVDPRFFAFHLQTNVTSATKGFKLSIVVNREYTPNRSAHEATIRGEYQKEITKELIEMDLYSRAYQKWLKIQGGNNETIKN